MQFLNALPTVSCKYPPTFEPLPVNTEKLIPSLVRAPELELKPLPSHLKYVYLGESKTLSVILLATSVSKMRSIADIKEISPTKRMHILEDDSKPTIDAQLRLNSIIIEVVRKEVLKRLDVGIIYPIFYSKWVSLVQVVSKKSGVTVVKNEGNELFPSRVQMRWCVCIDYMKLNIATGKDHFSLPLLIKCLNVLHVTITIVFWLNIQDTTKSL